MKTKLILLEICCLICFSSISYSHALIYRSITRRDKSIVNKIGDIWNDIKLNGKLTVLSGTNLGYFANYKNGSSNGLIDDNFYSYRWLSLDIGWSNEFDKSSQGTILGGISFHIKSFLEDNFPLSLSFIHQNIPQSAISFWDHTFIGFALGFNTKDSSFVYGLKTGLRFLF